MQRILVRGLPIALGGLVLSGAIAACGGPQANRANPATEPSAVAESPSSKPAPPAEPTADPALPPERGGSQPSIEVGQITGETLMTLAAADAA